MFSSWGLFSGLPQCKKADLMTPYKTEADRGNPQVLMSCGRDPISGTAILNNLDKKIKSSKQKGLPFRTRKGQCLKIVAAN